MESDLIKKYRALSKLTPKQAFDAYCRRCTGATRTSEIEKHGLCNDPNCPLRGIRTGEISTNLKGIAACYCIKHCDPELPESEVCGFRQWPCPLRHLAWNDGPISERKRASLRRKFESSKQVK